MSISKLSLAPCVNRKLPKRAALETTSLDKKSAFVHSFKSLNVSLCVCLFVCLQCLLLSEKLESLMSTLQKESQSSPGGPVLEQSYSLESTDADSSSDYDDMVRKLANIVHQTVIGDKEEIKERQEELEVRKHDSLFVCCCSLMNNLYARSLLNLK